MTSILLEFAFQAEELPKKLLYALQTKLTGVWHFQFNSQSFPRYLVVVQGRVIFSSTEKLSWQNFVKKLKRFIYKLRKPNAEEILSHLEELSNSGEINDLGTLLMNLEQSNIITHQEVIEASLLNILDNFDKYLFDLTGKAKFIHDETLIYKIQLPGFKLEDLLTRSMNRRIKWNQIKKTIPSIKHTLILNEKNLADSKLKPIQKKQVEQLFHHGKNLQEISYNLAKDTLEIAEICTKLTKKGIIKSFKSKIKGNIPQLFIVDDSSILVKRFTSLVSNWGYKVDSCIDSTKAMEKMSKLKPDLVFLDINMPGISGFELIKQMRRNKDLNSVNIVMLTGEKTMSNKWRAQWANCKFLTKPTSQEEVTVFRDDLQKILQELAPLSKK